MQGNAPDEEHEDPHGECAREIDRLKITVEQLEYAIGPFLRAAKVIADRPDDYGDRIVAIGGLATAADIMKRDFLTLLAVIQCPTCNGSGDVGDDSPRGCPECAGSGKRDHVINPI